MAIDLRRRGFADSIVGVDADPVNAAAAERIGLVDNRLAFSIMLWFETWPREALWLPKRKDKTRQMEGERSEAVQRQECSMRI